MQITHETARRLIQFSADEALQESDKKLLEEHLASCAECQGYAGRIEELELALTALMRKRWNRQPLPQPTWAARPKRNSKWIQDLAFATRIAAMGLVCIAFLFNIWQFTRSAGQGSGPVSASVPPIPTPSVFSTTTKTMDRKCEQFLYTVRENESLDEIANRFSVSTDDILTAGDLAVETLIPSMTLKIPLCGPTPHTPGAITTTFTPLLNPATSTPLTRPTQ